MPLPERHRLFLPAVFGCYRSYQFRPVLRDGHCAGPVGLRHLQRQSGTGIRPGAGGLFPQRHRQSPCYLHGAGCPLGLSRATVGHILKKLAALDYLSLMSFLGRHGSVIYLQKYLSTMFEISNVMVDKEEVAMTLNIRLELPQENSAGLDAPALEHEVIVSDELASVSKSHIEIILQKMSQILMSQGISCFSCPLSRYKLYPLSGDCQEDLLPRAQAIPDAFWPCCSVLWGYTSKDNLDVLEQFFPEPKSAEKKAGK